MQTSVSVKRRKELSVGSGDEVVAVGRGTGGGGLGRGGRVCVWGGGGRQERGLEVQDHWISSGFSYHMNVGLYFIFLCFIIIIVFVTAYTRSLPRQ